jgi:hypothetical protein
MPDHYRICSIIQKYGIIGHSAFFLNTVCWEVRAHAAVLEQA